MKIFMPYQDPYRWLRRTLLAFSFGFLASACAEDSTKDDKHHNSLEWESGTDLLGDKSISPDSQGDGAFDLFNYAKGFQIEIVGCASGRNVTIDSKSSFQSTKFYKGDSGCRGELKSFVGEDGRIYKPSQQAGDKKFVNYVTGEVATFVSPNQKKIDVTILQQIPSPVGADITALDGIRYSMSGIGSQMVASGLLSVTRDTTPFSPILKATFPNVGYSLSQVQTIQISSASSATFIITFVCKKASARGMCGTSAYQLMSGGLQVDAGANCTPRAPLACERPNRFRSVTSILPSPSVRYGGFSLTVSTPAAITRSSKFILWIQDPRARTRALVWNFDVSTSRSVTPPN